MNKWLYDEFMHCGVDYSDAAQAEMYDEVHQKFRDYEKEFQGMIDFLELQQTKDMTVIDLGCGTGATAMYAADVFRKIYAVDVSDVMIQQARKKLAKGEHKNIEFINAGFLTYHHEAEPVDLVITKHAFHHLPDFWKQIALLRMNKMLKIGGLLYMNDVVFQFSPDAYDDKISPWIETLKTAAGEQFGAEAEIHIKEEYSTFGWILDGMLQRAGFAIDKCVSVDEFITEYRCRKTSSVQI